MKLWPNKVCGTNITNGYLLVCDWLNRGSQSLIAGQNKQQKMLLSLRSNPQTKNVINPSEPKIV